jgi:hypothetical protein
VSPSTERVRHVLTRKKHTVRDSLVVVRQAARAVTRNRFLLRLIIGVVVITAATLFTWRTLGTPSANGRRSLTHSIVVALRFVVVLSLQFIVASWLFRTWRGDAPERIRHLWGNLLHRLPAFAVCALVMAWLDHTAAMAARATLLRSAVAFGFSYALSYAVPASAVFGTGLLKGFRHAYRVWRATFGADLFAWSGVWMVNGAMSLVAAVPDALDLYTPQSSGKRLSLVGRLVNWVIVVPAAITALAIASAFATVIFFALEENRAPGGFPKGPVETVSGLQLED